MTKALARRTAPHIAVVDGQPTTTSRDIAETFGKRHDNLLNSIRKLECSAEFAALNFKASGYTDVTGRTLTEYRITRDGFAFLCMGFTGAKAAQWKERYINTFNRMAGKLADHSAGVSKMVAAKPKAVLALPAPTLRPEVQAAINDRAWALAGDALAEIKPWLTAEVRKGALNPDGTPAPNFANTLAHADFAAFITQYASARIDTGLRLLTFIHNETGAIITALAAKQAELKGKP